MACFHAVWWNIVAHSLYNDLCCFASRQTTWNILRIIFTMIMYEKNTRCINKYYKNFSITYFLYMKIIQHLQNSIQHSLPTLSVTLSLFVKFKGIRMFLFSANVLFLCHKLLKLLKIWWDWGMGRGVPLSFRFSILIPEFKDYALCIARGGG